MSEDFPASVSPRSRQGRSGHDQTIGSTVRTIIRSAYAGTASMLSFLKRSSPIENRRAIGRIRTMNPWRRDFRSSKQAAAPSRSRRRCAPIQSRPGGTRTSAIGGVMSKPTGWAIAVALVAIPIACATPAGAQNVRHYRFAYDQPRSTGYGVAADIFSNKLTELSHGTMLIDQFPASQLGQEPQVLQLLKSGDIDFSVTSTANTAISPHAAVISLHFLFRSDNHLTT